VSSAADLKPRFAEAATSLRSFNPNPLFRVIKEQVGPLFMLGREQVQKARHWPVMEALLTISNTPLSEKRQSAVYVPRSNSAYWSLSHQCEVTPIIVPAIAAVAMIDGLPGPDCKTTGWAHHYSAYKALSAESEALGGFQEMQMCSHAKAKGFSRVIVLDQDQSGAIVTRKVPCP
jgi:hypothetical protein